MKYLVLILIAFIPITACHALPVTTLSSQTQEDFVSIHNQLRGKHHAPPLLWDNKLAYFAAQHASDCIFRHSSPHRYGENLAAGYSSVRNAIYAWYREKQFYDANRPGYSHQTGHFTQVIWKSSRKLGCGVAYCNGMNGTPGQYIVCEYSPAGNIVNPGYFRRNVLFA